MPVEQRREQNFAVKAKRLRCDRSRLRAEIKRDHHRPFLALPAVKQQIALRRDRHITARHQLRQSLSQRDQRLVEAQDRLRVGIEIDHVLPRKIIRKRQPRRRYREARTGRRVPLHRRAAAVAAHPDPRNVLLKGIAHLIRRDRDLMHADLVAVIERRRSPQGQQQHRGDARLRRPDPACHPRTVVIAEHPVWPRSRRQRFLVIGNELLDRTRAPQGRQQREVERHLRAGKIVAVIGHQPVQGQIDLPDQHAGVELIDHPPHLGDHVMNFRLVGRVLRQDRLMRRPPFAIIRIGRIVAKRRILDQVPDHVDAKAVDALAEPEAHDVMDRLAHFRIAPVQIGLLGEEGVVIILPRRGVVFPGAAAEFRQPVVRWAAVRARLAPDVPVALRILARAAAGDEPGMLVRGVVRHQIEDQFEAGRMRGRYQRVEILHRAEQRIDVDVIGNVIAEIGHRRRKDRRQPDSVNAEVLQIGQPVDDPLDIADPVGIGVLKRARIDLIENTVPPPVLVALIYPGKSPFKSGLSETTPKTPTGSGR